MKYLRKLAELINVNKDLAEELFNIHNEFVFQNVENEKHGAELIIANKKLSVELEIALKELALQYKEKTKRAKELIIANKELAFQKGEKAKRAAELVIANQKLEYQTKLAIASDEIAHHHEEKAMRTAELIIANKRLEELVQLNADMNLFLSTLAHDMKSPYTVLLGYSELLLENIHKVHLNKIEEFVKEIQQSAQIGFALLDDLLKWARMKSGKINFEPQKLNFSDIGKTILEIFSPIANSKNITLTYSCTPEIFVFADPDMLKAVLRNLVSNAIKFTNNNGTIKICAEEKSDNLLISVEDNGIGIKSDSLEKLFDISQIQATRDLAGEKGTGLGLILCKEFIERHGGKIWVTSQLGKGTEFKFTLPLSDTQPIK